MTATWILAALVIALTAALAADHHAGNRRVKAALDRANRERADKMLAFKAIDEALKNISRPVHQAPLHTPGLLPRRVPGAGPQIPTRRRGAA